MVAEQSCARLIGTQRWFTFEKDKMRGAALDRPPLADESMLAAVSFVFGIYTKTKIETELEPHAIGRTGRW